MPRVITIGKWRFDRPSNGIIHGAYNNSVSTYQISIKIISCLQETSKLHVWFESKSIQKPTENQQRQRAYFHPFLPGHDLGAPFARLLLLSCPCTSKRLAILQYTPPGPTTLKLYQFFTPTSPSLGTWFHRLSQGRNHLNGKSPWIHGGFGSQRWSHTTFQYGSIELYS